MRRPGRERRSLGHDALGRRAVHLPGCLPKDAAVERRSGWEGPMAPSRDTLLWMYETMATSRRYEEAIAKVYLEGKQPVFNMANGPIPGEMHLSDV